jgi:hypothetical protein
MVPVASEPALAAALRRRPALSGEQRRMVERLTRDEVFVQVVVGKAGTGKTRRARPGSSQVSR